MDETLETDAEMVVKPYIVKLYEKGIVEGYKKGFKEGIKEGKIEGKKETLYRLITAFAKKNPDWSGQRISTSFDVDEAIVTRILSDLSVK